MSKKYVLALDQGDGMLAADLAAVLQANQGEPAVEAHNQSRKRVGLQDLRH